MNYCLLSGMEFQGKWVFMPSGTFCQPGCCKWLCRSYGWGRGGWYVIVWCSAIWRGDRKGGTDSIQDVAHAALEVAYGLALLKPRFTVTVEMTGEMNSKLLAGQKGLLKIQGWYCLLQLKSGLSIDMPISNSLRPTYCCQIAELCYGRFPLPGRVRHQHVSGVSGNSRS